MSSNDVSLGDLSDYTALLESLHDIRHTILFHRNRQLSINRLPVEILTTICQFTLPALRSEFTKPDNNRVFKVIILTHVCRHWRLVLISSSELWSSFRVIKAVPKFLAECLQRSKTSPIHVSFEWDSCDPDYCSPPASAFDDGGSVEGEDGKADGNVIDDDGDMTDGGGNVVDKRCVNRASSSEPEDSDWGTSSHSTLSIYSDHHDRGYSWTAYLKEAQNYHYLIQQSHRIATLDIYLPRPVDEDEEEDNPFACGLLIYPLPALQTLMLRCFHGRHVSIPRAILDEHFTTIKNLLLENIPPTQIVNLSLNLTSLVLVSTLSDIAIDTGPFLRFLGKNQNLRSLALHNYRFSSAQDSVSPVSWSNLRQLNLTFGFTLFDRQSYSSFKMRIASRPLCLSAGDSTAGASTSVSNLFLCGGPDPNQIVSVASVPFGSVWEEATHAIVAIPIGGWERGFVDKLLSRLTRLSVLSMVSLHDRMERLFDSLGTSKDRCPNLKRICICVTPVYLPNVLKSVRRLVERRAEYGIPLEAVEQTHPSLFAEGVWNDLYSQWRIKDYLKAKDSR